MALNENTMDLSQFKGEVIRCPECRTPMGAQLAANRTACKVCMNRGFIAKCTNCDATGLYKGKSVWDGGRSDHASVCTPCGGSGSFPVNKPKDWDAREHDVNPNDAPVCTDPQALASAIASIGAGKA